MFHLQGRFSGKQQRPVRSPNRPLLLHPIGYSLARSGNFSGFAEFGAIRSDPATRLAGKFHCRQFLFAHMGSSDISCPAIRAGKYFNGRVAQMTRIIRDSPTIFTGMRHNQASLYKRLYSRLFYLFFEILLLLLEKTTTMIT